MLADLLIRTNTEHQNRGLTNHNIQNHHIHHRFSCKRALDGPQLRATAGWNYGAQCSLTTNYLELCHATSVA